MSVLAAGVVPTGKPEDVGFSSERLGRIKEAVQRHIDSGNVPGAVTLVARRGKVVHFEAHGLNDVEARKPMPKDAIFRLASMSKPIAATAVMLMIEEGKVRLNDPVSRFIPEFKQAMAERRAEGPCARLSGAWRRPVAQRGPQDTLAICRLGAVRSISSRARCGATAVWPGSTCSAGSSRSRRACHRSLLQQRLFDPLGMKDTGFTITAARQPRMAIMYRRVQAGGFERQADQSGLSSPRISVPAAW